MADNKRNRGRQDRAKVSVKQTYEVAYIAKVWGVWRGLVREIVKEYGPSRRKVYAALKAMAGATL